MSKVKMTAKRKVKFIETLAQTGNVTLSAKLVGMTRSLPYQHRESDPQFKAAWDEALETATDVLEAEARRRALEGVKKPVYQGGKRCGYVQEYSDTMLIFLLKAKRPKEFTERREIGGTLNITHEAALSELDDD